MLATPEIYNSPRDAGITARMNSHHGAVRGEAVRGSSSFALTPERAAAGGSGGGSAHGSAATFWRYPDTLVRHGEGPLTAPLLPIPGGSAQAGYRHVKISSG